MTRTLRLDAKRTLDSGRQAVTFTFREANGFEPQPARLAFETRRFYPPSLVISDVGIQDAGRDGQMEPGELVTVTVRIRNEGDGVAKDVTATVHLGDNVYEGPGFQPRTHVGMLRPGEHHDISSSSTPISALTTHRSSSTSVSLTVSSERKTFAFRSRSISPSVPFRLRW